MGKAIIIPDVSFATSNLGRVTLTNEIPLQALSITAPPSFTGTTLQLLAEYFPLNTTQRGVTWSIISGGQYATINANTGVLTVLSDANSDNVTIKVASNDATGIETTKTIEVTYSAGGVPVPVYTIEREYTQFVAQTEKISRVNTPVNSDYIVMIYLSDELRVGTTTRVFSYTQLSVPYNGWNIGTDGSVSGFAIWKFPEQQPPTFIPLLGKRKMAVKKQGNDVYVTTDGFEWQQLGGSVNLGLSTDFAFGKDMIGTLKADFYNDLTIDVAPFFI